MSECRTLMNGFGSDCRTSHTMRFLLRSVAIIGGLILFAGCSRPDPVSVPDLAVPPSVTGRWRFNDIGGLTLTIQVGQRGTDLTGGCTVSDGTTSLNGVAFGSVGFPDVEFTVNVPGFLGFRFTGSMRGSNLMDGVLNGSGFTNFPVIGAKQ